MKVKELRRVGRRGTMFTFDDDITVYLIEGKQVWLVCDTHLGPHSMMPVQEYIKQHGPDKEIMVFNSHSDWDHVWGNCAFFGSSIIAHTLCPVRLQRIGAGELRRLQAYQQGPVELVMPQMLFDHQLVLAEEEIEFYYMPGHTVDSAVCFDRADGVLFTGDLAEAPIPYLDWHDLERYLATLLTLQDFPAKIIVTAHSGIIDRQILQKNTDYVRNMAQGVEVGPDSYAGAAKVHFFNLNNRLLWQQCLATPQGEEGYWQLREQLSPLEDATTGEILQAVIQMAKDNC